MPVTESVGFADGGSDIDTTIYKMTVDDYGKRTDCYWGIDDDDYNNLDEEFDD